MGMFSIPPLPSFAGLHPLVVHFPIALLLITPLLLAMGIIFSRDRRPFAIVTLAILLMGTAGAWVASYSGEAAEEAVEDLSPAEDVIGPHEDYGRFARNAFTVISVLYTGFTVLLIKRGEKLGSGAFAGTQLGFIVLCAAGSLVVANAGHLGGRIVHQYGIRAPIAEGQAAAAAESQDDDESASGDDESGSDDDGNDSAAGEDAGATGDTDSANSNGESGGEHD